MGSILTAEMLGSILTAEMLVKAISKGNHSICGNARRKQVQGGSILLKCLCKKQLEGGTHSNYTPGLEVRMPLWWKDVDFKKRPAYRVKNPGGILTLFI